MRARCGRRGRNGATPTNVVFYTVLYPACCGNIALSFWLHPCKRTPRPRPTLSSHWPLNYSAVTRRELRARVVRLFFPLADTLADQSCLPRRNRVTCLTTQFSSSAHKFEVNIFLQNKVEKCRSILNKILRSKIQRDVNEQSQFQFSRNNKSWIGELSSAGVVN